SGEHLLMLINDILDLAKIESGRLALTPAPLLLTRFLDDIVGIIRARAQAKQLALIFEAPPSLPRWVEADETRLRQVLLNLLGNAVKFTDSGQVTLSVRTEGRGLRSESSNDLLSPQSSVPITFEVTDTGSGIAP